MRDTREIAKRTKRHPLSKPQLDVLAKLFEHGPATTAKSTWGVYVCGTATAALVRRGLVRMKPRRWGHNEIADSHEYEITKTGREALRLANARAALACDVEDEPVPE